MLIGQGQDQKIIEYDGSNSDSSFQNDLNSIVVEFDKATKEAETMSIFETIFLERKVLLTLLTFRKVLEATEEVACLAITLIQKRLDVAKKERD